MGKIGMIETPFIQIGSGAQECAWRDSPEQRSIRENYQLTYARADMAAKEKISKIETLTPSGMNGKIN